MLLVLFTNSFTSNKWKLFVCSKYYWFDKIVIWMTLITYLFKFSHLLSQCTTVVNKILTDPIVCASHPRARGSCIWSRGPRTSDFCSRTARRILPHLWLLQNDSNVPRPHRCIPTPSSPSVPRIARIRVVRTLERRFQSRKVRVVLPARALVSSVPLIRARCNAAIRSALNCDNRYTVSFESWEREGQWVRAKRDCSLTPMHNKRKKKRIFNKLIANLLRDSTEMNEWRDGPDRCRPCLEPYD